MALRIPKRALLAQSPRLVNAGAKLNSGTRRRLYTRRDTANAGWVTKGTVGIGLLGAVTLGITMHFQTNDSRRHIHHEIDGKIPKDTQAKTQPDSQDDRRQVDAPLTAQDILSFGGWSFFRTSLPTDKITEYVSGWTWPAALASLQGRVGALLLELSRGKGSLYEKIANAPVDPMANPECDWDAEVRLGDELCVAERAYLRGRKRRMRQAFAKLFGVPVEDIDERDIPIVAIAGSGGGFRAMCNTAGALKGAKSNGLLDCTTYIAGISGSCWALGVMYSGVAGSPSPDNVIEHIKQRVAVPYLDMSTLDMLITPPTNKYLLSGIVQKAIQPKGDVSITDVYGTLISARLYVPSDLSRLDQRHLSLHRFRRFVDNAAYPLPIFTAISRQLQPPSDTAKAEAKEPAGKKQTPSASQEEKDLKQQARWLWFEFTPYEFGSDELGAWIPSWSLGREFNNGRSLDRSRELSFSILTGIFASAFCASLQHYLKEVQPIVKEMPTAVYGWLQDIFEDQSYEHIHPVTPNALPNYVKGIKYGLRSGSPAGIEQSDSLGFLDAGAELNIPYYPLLRRNVDCIIALDASADSQDLWFTKAEEYAARRGLQTWPQGARWPVTVPSPGPDKVAASQSQEAAAQNTKQRTPATSSPEGSGSEARSSKEAAMTPEEANRAIAESKTEEVAVQKSVTDDSGSSTSVSETSARYPGDSAYVWIGSSKDTSGPSRLDEMSEEDLAMRDGIGIVYMPLIPNEEVPGMDPADISTWRTELQPEETDKLVKLAELNFALGQEKVTKVLRAMWQRNKRERQERERLETEVKVKPAASHR
ncbi:hypothetical protein BOTBODRAFT_168945 [Botryobasidium botryosum FD-172 SS1]|uniref:Lysophospholipase n=1 Tax=Botryobasidium botryosum (strain FD-172 SS1) TaxID=930990 RepID=A0A067N146_BOTB1|nr:hypothetical protein BOTBODRAFT_168945 [Botryobasidium botryosum FD-172 SS1]